MVSIEDTIEFAKDADEDLNGVVLRSEKPENNAPKWLETYVLTARDRLGLKDWSLFINVESLEREHAAACCKVTYGRRLATITFDTATVEGSLVELRQTVVHELLHCHFAPVLWSFLNCQKPLGQTVFTVLYDGFIDSHELAIDSVAQAWALELPSPERPGEATPDLSRKNPRRAKPA